MASPQLENGYTKIKNLNFGEDFSAQIRYNYLDIDQISFHIRKKEVAL